MTTTAREKFTEGQSVRMTQEGIDKFIDNCNPKRRRAVVTGFPNYSIAGPSDVLVEVIRQGEKKPRRYHMDFWEPAQ